MRRAFAAVVLITVTLVLPLSPVLSSWLVRGESTTKLVTCLAVRRSGRRCCQAPAGDQQIFGSGMGNGGVIGMNHV